VLAGEQKIGKPYALVEPYQNMVLTSTRSTTKWIGEQRQLYFALEELLSERVEDREAAMFNRGFEHGFADGNASATPQGPVRPCVAVARR
jgi:hypothetical protein